MRNTMYCFDNMRIIDTYYMLGLIPIYQFDMKHGILL